MWLLEMTGDPKRVVTHLFDHLKQKEIRFSFNSFKFPACEECNSAYCEFESKAKGIVKRLNLAEPLLASEYLHLLDWLDKVRIGLWIARMYLENSFDFINPKFFISDRVGTKDRAVLVYRFPEQKDGLNALGYETVCFRFLPSVFGLRINQTLLVNVSYDAYFSKYLGCYYPIDPYFDMDRGGILNSGFSRGNLRPEKLIPKFKPVVAIHQSILDIGQTVAGNYYLESGVSLPFLLRDQELKPLAPEDAVNFDSVMGSEMAYTWQIQAYIYDWQLALNSHSEFRGPKDKIDIKKKFDRIIKKETVGKINQFILDYKSKFPDECQGISSWKDYVRVRVSKM